MALSVPVGSRLPSALRIDPKSPTATRILGRLTRPALLSLALDWLEPDNQPLTRPHLRRRRDLEDEDEESDEEEDDDFYPPAASLAALQEYYVRLQGRKGSKREVLDRMLEGDWRHGLSLYQLAMADLQHLYDHPTSQKWTAFKMVPVKLEEDGENEDPTKIPKLVLDKTAMDVPRFHPSSFLRSLQAHILPDVKVHYNFDRHRTLPLLLLRMFVVDSPYTTRAAAGAATAAAPAASATATGPKSKTDLTTVEAARTLYIAFPDGSPYVYLSNESFPSTAASASTSASTARSLRNLVVDAIPKALSRPHARCMLQPTSLTSRNLAAILQRRGAGRTNAAGGGWSIYADEKVVESPLQTVLTPPKEGAKSRTKRRTAKEEGERTAKRRRIVAEGRFGTSGRIADGMGIERFDVVLQDPYPGETTESDQLPPPEADIETNRLPPEADTQAEQPPEADTTKRQRRRRSRMDTMLARETEAADAEEAAENNNNNDDDDHNDNDNNPAKSTWIPRVGFTFHGTHVFAGIRQLVEMGVIDGEKMPGWMTGEDGVSIGVVKHGRIRGNEGAGL